MTSQSLPAPRKRLRRALLSTSVVIATGVLPVAAQDRDEAAERARVQAGPIAVAPTIRVANAGYDSNVYNEADSATPRSDVSLTVTPSAEAWLRLPRAQLRLSGELDAIYYRELTELRSFDTANAARLDVRLHRVTPYVDATWARTRHRRDLEIDLPAQRTDRTVLAGASVRLTQKAAIGAQVRRGSVHYESDALYLGSDLAEALNRESTAEELYVRYALTPLTTLTLNTERQRDRFDATADRDADSVRVLPGVEFSPFALVSGRAQVGFRTRRFTAGDRPEFRGAIARVNVGYTLLGRTRLGVEVQRDLSYSYRVEREEYLSTGVSLSVEHRLAEPWDVRGRIGRHRLAYRVGETQAGRDAETVQSYGVDLGYRFGRSRVSANLAYQRRTSGMSAWRDYDRFRAGSALTYGF